MDYTKLFDHQALSHDEAFELLTAIGRGQYNDAQIAALITAYRMRNITIDELDGFRDALLASRVPVDLRGMEVVDIVGTGGDGKNTFNISTCACFVVAGAGYRVVKHGNGGATSVSGASNVMEQHGVRFTTDNDRLLKSLDECGVMYLHAPLFNPALKAVAGVRRAIGFRSFFNILGPLVNPAKPTHQLLGVSDLPLMRLYTYLYQQTGTQYAVVSSLDGYDEISLTADFKVVTPQEERLYTLREFGLTPASPASLSGGATVEEAAAIFDRVLTGTALDEQTRCVLFNAAFAIRLLNPSLSLADALAAAQESIDSGAALRCFTKFLQLNS